MIPRLLSRLFARIRLCRSPAGLPPGTIVLFPVDPHRLACGLAGIVEVVRDEPGERPDPAPARAAAAALPDHGLGRSDGEDYAGGEPALAALESLVRALRLPAVFPVLYDDAEYRERLAEIARAVDAFAGEEADRMDRGEVLPDPAVQEVVNARLVRLRDAAWAIERELLANVDRVRELVAGREASPKAIREYRKANLILNALDRLEIRGRDSAGISFQAAFPDAAAADRLLEGCAAEVAERAARPDFTDGALARSDDGAVVTLVYKVAAEVGKLGDNVAALRKKVAADDLLHALLSHPEVQVLVMAHTRWASNGIINLANCHPLDNACAEEAAPPALGEGHPRGPRAPRIHVALNGDIDNYLALRRRFEDETGRRLPERITTDAKIIALWIDHYLRKGHDLEEAFLRAVADFEGSAAILMMSDLEPGRLFLSLKGSGQSLYVGLPPEGYVVASEIYGLVEETDRFVKLSGEKERVPGDGRTRGQVFVLDRGRRGPDGIRAFGHDGVPIPLDEDAVQAAEITTRDVDRGDFPHYFLKEVAQAHASVAKTLRGKSDREGRIRFGEETIGPRLGEALAGGRLARIAVVGQGTAAVAAQGVAAFLGDCLAGSGIHVAALKASELSGFGLRDEMSDTLVIAVTQSGATADTNRAVDLAKERGAHTLAIVNRRNSDITFKTEGVLYTSDGRDVEMSVASTKAFYSQVAAGALLGLALGRRAGALSAGDASLRIEELRELPRLLREVFALGPRIEEAARTLAPTRRYWAVVGSGPNRIAAEEVRIKLSELCYKSISSDSVEDKKHIDLSSESLMLVLAAGNGDAVLRDLAKDVAIFKAHRALPVVFATRGDRRFDAYAAAVIELPEAPPLLSMILCTMAGHLFGYHAARAIDEGARFLGRIRSLVVRSLDANGGMMLRELADLQREYRARLRSGTFASALEAETAAELLLLLKYAAGEIPPLSFGEEYGRGVSVADIHSALLEHLVRAIDQTSRPIDAIKHQAKIVTVGTSRTEEEPEGVIFAALAAAGLSSKDIPLADRARLSEMQLAVGEVTGLTRYALENLREDGSPGPDTRIRAVARTGSAAAIVSRAEQWVPLKGTKRAVVKERRAYIGVGLKDGRRIAIVPLVDHRYKVNALALLHLAFREEMTVGEKIRALGDRYEEIVNGVTEADVPWRDDLLAPISPDELFTSPPAALVQRLVRA